MQALDSLETDSSLIGIEVFSGMHRLSTEFRNLVGDFETFEIHDTSDENILLKRGILNLFRKLLRVIKRWNCLVRCALPIMDNIITKLD